eukprot:6090283-Ditylum_brightwellii.AAC.1
MVILSASVDLSVMLINSHLEIHGSCQHKPRLHRFCFDDSCEEERVWLTGRHQCITIQNCYSYASPVQHIN